MRRYRAFLVVADALLSSLPVFAAGQLFTCNESNLDTALSSGGLVRFHCDGSIVFSSTKTITGNTFIDANGHNVIFDGNDTRRLFIVNSGANLTLQGLTLTGGRDFGADGITPSAGQGGSLYNSGTVVINRCVFSNNQVRGGSAILGPIFPPTPKSAGAPGHGSAIFNNGGALAITVSTCSGNHATGGQGVSGNASPLFGNSPQAGGGGSGGAVYDSFGTRTTISGSTFSQNSVTGGTGGTGGDSTSSIFGTINGQAGAIGGDGAGGAIYFVGPADFSLAPPRPTNSTFSGNNATGGVGGTGGSFSPGAAGSGGQGGSALGGALFYVADTVISSTTFELNGAVGGAGGAHGFGGGTVGSSGTGQGGHIYSSNDGHHMSLRDVALDDLGASSNSVTNCFGPFPNNQSSASTDTSCGGSPNMVTIANMNLGPLANNGGPTQTHAITQFNGLVNTGGDPFVNSCPTLDQRRFPRVDTCDIGSFEFRGAAPSLFLFGLSAASASVMEGNAGTTPIAFTVTPNWGNIPPDLFTVNYNTADLTATAGSDYIPQTASISFYPNETSKDAIVDVIGDTTDEFDETFKVAFSAMGFSPNAIGTILNDDQPPTLSINDVAAAEGNSGTTQFSFTVSLSQPSGKPITFDYATADGAATLADNDYQSAFSNALIPAGQGSAEIDVAVNGDSTVEPDENFFVNLSNLVNAGASKLQGQGTIVNDDDYPFSAAPGRTRFLTGRHFTSLVAVITDTDPAAVNDFTATIDWGDGIASQGTVVSNGDGTFNVYGTHTYMTLGGYSADVTITSTLGATAFTTTPARFWPRPDR